MMDNEALLAELRSIRGELKKISDRLGSPNQDLFTMPQAARRLGIGQTKLREIVQARKLSVVTLGRRRMVPASELERLARPSAPAAKQPRALRAKRTPAGVQDAEMLRQRSRQRQKARRA